MGFGAHRAILTSGSRSSTPRSWKGAVLDPVGGSATARGGSGPAHAGGIQTSSDVGWKDVALANSTAARRAGSGATEPTRESPKTRADLAATPATNARRATVEPTPRASVGSPARNERGAGAPEGGDNNKGAEKVGGPGANAPFFAARTTWTRRTGATRAGAAARTAEPATRARAESTTGVEVIADIVVPMMADWSFRRAVFRSRRVHIAASFHVGARLFV